MTLREQMCLCEGDLVAPTLHPPLKEVMHIPLAEAQNNV